MIRVVFVCLGNICRSPMADGVMQDLVNQAGLSDKIEVDSAGTGGWHVGDSAHHGTRKILKKHNIPYDGRARQFRRDDISRFDYVLAMDKSNLHNIHRLIGESKPENTVITLFLHYANQVGITDIEEVPDPYYTGDFDHVYKLVESGCIALLAHIRDTHKL